MMKLLVLLLLVTSTLQIFIPLLILFNDPRNYYVLEDTTTTTTPKPTTTVYPTTTAKPTTTAYLTTTAKSTQPTEPTHGDDVVVVFKGTFKCQRKNFCAVVYYTEEDRYYGDFMAYVPLHCTRTNYLKHDLILNLKNYGGWFEGPEFEPKIKIFHDCIDVGVLKGVEIELSTVSRDKPFHVVSYTESLWRRGVTPYKPRIDYYFFYYSSWGYTRHQDTHDWKIGEDVTGREELFYRPLVYFKDIEVDKEGNIRIVKDE